MKIKKKKDGDKIGCSSGVQDRVTVFISYLVMTTRHYKYKKNIFYL